MLFWLQISVAAAAPRVINTLSERTCPRNTRLVDVWTDFRQRERDFEQMSVDGSGVGFYEEAASNETRGRMIGQPCRGLRAVACASNRL